MQRQYPQRRTSSIVTVAVAAAVAIVVSGCSFSASSKSISTVVSSAIKSSSKSSRSSSPEQAYKADVADYTAAYLKSGGDTAKLKSQISKVAEKRGITDWENNSGTYQGLGQGLKRAGVKQVELDAYKHNLADTDEQASWMQQGYDSASKDE